MTDEEVEDAEEEKSDEPIELEVEDKEEEIRTAEDRIRKAYEGLKPEDYERAALTAAVGLAFFGLLAAGSVLFDQPDRPELTQYQKDYVDCPYEYLETCTAMSNIGTSNVSFWKVEDERLYLKLQDGRAIVSTLPRNGSRGEFLTYMSAAEVPSRTP